MIIECPNCNKKFSIDKKLIPENGRTLKCSSCDHIWHYKIPITESVDDLEISEAKNFYFAEEYHQQYLAKIPNGYCNHGFCQATYKDK